MTETTGGISLSTKKDLSVATVGQTLPGVKIKLKDWAEGDYLVQGKNDIGPCGEILIGGPMVASGKELFRIGQNTSHQISFLKLQLRGAYVPLKLSCTSKNQVSRPYLKTSLPQGIITIPNLLTSLLIRTMEVNGFKLATLVKLIQKMVS